MMLDARRYPIVSCLPKDRLKTTRLIPLAALTVIALLLPTPKAWAQG
jgi:hypothetical protein